MREYILGPFQALRYIFTRSNLSVVDSLESRLSQRQQLLKRETRALPCLNFLLAQTSSQERALVLQ